MRLLFIFIIAISFANPVLAQKAYFQQEVNYTISGTLDDIEHVFSGEIKMEYINNSPDALDKIVLHLWANAFKDRTSAFNRQKIRQGSTGTYFAEVKDLGNYTELDFKVDGKTAELSYVKDNPDIAHLGLAQPLQPGGKIIISSPFKLKIPASFSRLGHVDQTYQMTQWYPKPAVYDVNGWNAMPYLDMGEFYSEFGSFDVTITLPENYIVGSTGELQTASEKEFLASQVQKSNEILKGVLPKDYDIPESSNNMKTIRYTAENVHDFAWFADKRFYVQHGNVSLASGKKIDTWTFFTNREGELWKKSLDYVDRSVLYYSDKVGEYPYPQATAVQSALSAGGGMEYPMITVIGLSGDPKSLDVVITHEVGHNWFYGILGFDERTHPWLDEGINSYYDHRYQYDYYGDAELDMLPSAITKTTDYILNELGVLIPPRQGTDQPVSSHSDDFISLNYWIGAYEKPAEAFRYLQKYLGDEDFDQAMKSFYEAWKFKHPSPEDFVSHMKSNTKKNIDWFFDGWIYSTDQMDYAVSSAKVDGDKIKVSVKNKGHINGPFPLQTVVDGKVQQTFWQEGFEGSKDFEIPTGTSASVDYVSIDHEHWGIDINRRNNEKAIDGKNQAIRIKPFFGIEKTATPSVYVAPVFAWNNYDKSMLGIALYNKSVPKKKFEFGIVPTYSFVTKKLRGTGEVNYNIYTKNKFVKNIKLGFGVKSYARNYNWLFDYYLDYKRYVPSIEFKLGKKKVNSSFDHSLSYRAIFLDEDEGTFGRDSSDNISYLGNISEQTLTHNLRYKMTNKKGVNPFGLTLDIRQGNYVDGFNKDQSYLRTSLTLNTEYTYARGRAVKFRFFLGGFLNSSTTESNSRYTVVSRTVRGTFDATNQGFNDELYDEFFFGRSENSGIFSQQVALEEGGFKNAFGSAVPFGTTNSLLASANVIIDLPQNLPLNLPIRPYLDFGYVEDKDGKNAIGEPKVFKDKFLFSFGLTMSWFDDRLAIHFPIASSEAIKNLYPERGNYFGRITYTVDFNRLNPIKLADNINF